MILLVFILHTFYNEEENIWKNFVRGLSNKTHLSALLAFLIQTNLQATRVALG